jgi:hypothetical protein
MISNNPYVNFASGELSPNVWARTDRPFYTTGLEIMRNFIPLLTGGAFYRPGFRYINHTRLNKKAFLLPFEFNDEQAYVLEFTDLKMRVIKDGGVVTETAKTVTGATQAAQGVITSATHGFADGDEVYFASVGGMTQLNGNFYIVSDKDTNTFKLKDIDGNYINTTAYGAYTSGGTVARVYEITTPYAEADLWQLKMAQTADLAYIVHRFYEPMKLARTGHAAWTLAVYPRTADPFIGALKNITAATKANPCKVTVTTHGYTTGQRIRIASVVGMTELNGNSYYITKVDADNFTLSTLAGVPVNSSGYGAWSSGGTVALERFPAAAGFYGGRLHMGGPDDAPDTWWGSKAPNSTTGASQFDDFTVGTAAGDAFTFTITSQNGTADQIRWFSGNSKSMLIGTFGGVYKANGGSDGAPITPTAISVAPISSYGAANQNPIFVGSQTVYIETGGRTLRSFEFDLLTDAYSAFDKNILAEEITYGGVVQTSFTQGRPDLIWAVRADGVLLSCTFLSREEVAGWARHQIGGEGKVLSAAADYRADNFDRLVICVERTIDGHTRRYLEYNDLDPQMGDITDQYTDVDSEDDDTLRFLNLEFEKQKEFVRLDSALILDTTQAATLTLSLATVGTGRTATAGSSVFTAADVGKYIFIKYLTGDESGVAKITAYVSGTEVTVQIIQAFASTSVATSGWYKLTSTVTGLGHLEGETIGIVTDGGVHADKTVADGAITLDYPARYVILGYKYFGIGRSLDLEYGAQIGIAQGRPRNIHRLIFKFRNTMGGKFGTSTKQLYKVSSLAFRKSRDLTDRPPPLFTGMKEPANFDDWSISKRFYFVQDEPQPMTVLAVIPMMDVTTE